MTRDKLLLLDVGGTYIKCHDGRQVRMPSGGGAGEIRAALQEAVGDTSRLSGVGVAIPGPFDYSEGVFQMKHKFASVYGWSFRHLALIPEDVPVRFMHDVNAPLAGAVKILGLRGKNSALVTLGTGLGFACAIDGTVQCNESGSPSVSLWNRPWEDGILEDKVSARGLRASYAALTGMQDVSAKEIGSKAYAGEEAAVEAFRQLGAALGAALLPLVEEYRLDLLLFAGQVSRSLAHFAPALALDSHCMIAPAPEGAVFAGLKTLFEQ